MFHWSLHSIPSSPAACSARCSRAMVSRYQAIGRRSGTSCRPVAGSVPGAVHHQGSAPTTSRAGVRAAAEASSEVRTKSRRVGMAGGLLIEVSKLR